LKISVITAVYKSEATVGEAIASVAAQTHADLEHVIVEGKSPGHLYKLPAGIRTGIV